MRGFRDWSESVRVEFEVASTLGTWLATAAIAGLMVLAASKAPGIAEFFNLHPHWALGAFAVAMGLDLIAARVPNQGAGLIAFGVLNVVGSAFLQLFSGLLMVSSSAWGAAVFSSTLLLTALYHGHALRSTLRHPYQTLATVAAVGVTAALSPTRQHLAIVLVSGPVAVFGSLVFGTIAVRTARLRAESERLRVAVAAQFAHEQATRADRLANSLERMAMWNHDMRNSLAVATGYAKLLERMSPDEFSNASAVQTVKDCVAGIRKSVDALMKGLDDTRQLVRQHRAEIADNQAVEVAPIAQAVASAARVRFPEVDFAISDPEGAARARVHGGEQTLRRALENLVFNACEGDGSHGARRVEISLGAAEGFVRIRVADDGPGFSQAQLEKGPTVFETTKANGTGLGLYTVDHLVTASGGVLQRANRDGGGAEVTMSLPRRVEA